MIDAKPTDTLKVEITKAITRHTAKATLERLFMADRAVRGPIETREKNFKDKPKRRGGRIWTKYTNKVHPVLTVGKKASIPATSYFLKDLASVSEFVSVSK